MAGNRRKATEVAVQLLKEIAPKTNNWKIWQDKLNAMSDKEFQKFHDEVVSGESYFVMLLPNLMESGITVENCRAIAKRLGYDFFQRVWVKGKEGEPDYLTKPANIITLPDRRQSQVLRKKVSVPKGNVINAMTGQPTGDSKGARTSLTELQLANAMGLKNTMVELMKMRGGDTGARMAMNGMLSNYGQARQSEINKYSTGAVSTKTLKSFMTAAHIKTTL